MTSLHSRSYFSQEEGGFGASRVDPRKVEVFSALRPASKVRRSRVPRGIRESFSQGAAALGVFVFLGQPAAGVDAASMVTGNTPSPVVAFAPDAIASENPLTTMAEAKVAATTYSSIPTPSSDIANTAPTIEDPGFDELIRLTESEDEPLTDPVEEWFRSHPGDISKYEGQVVALIPGEGIVASSKSFAELYEQASNHARRDSIIVADAPESSEF
jgi:hypothetical protein